MTALPVPVRCAGRPLVGGLVVPWISFEHGGHAAFGTVDPRRRAQALLRKLCQICGQPLEERICLAVRPMDVKVGYAPEPGLHPECMAYSARRCPMINGTATSYRSSAVTAGHPAGRPCDDPTCPCPRIAPGDDQKLRAGRPADAYDSWMIAPSSYRVKRAAEQPNTLLGLDLDVPVLRIRPLRQAPEPRLTASEAERLLAALRALGL